MIGLRVAQTVAQERDPYMNRAVFPSSPHLIPNRKVRNRAKRGVICTDEILEYGKKDFPRGVINLEEIAECQYDATLALERRSGDDTAFRYRALLNSVQYPELRARINKQGTGRHILLM